MNKDVITLVNKNMNTLPDEFGNRTVQESKREVFATVKSVSQSEFYQANANGFKPEIKFVIYDYFDYENENFVEYENTRYEIIRTFRNGLHLEIVCQGVINHGST